MLGRSLGIHQATLAAEQAEHDDHDKPQFQHLDLALLLGSRSTGALPAGTLISFFFSFVCVEISYSWQR